MGVVVLGTGSYLPEKIVTNSDLEKIVNTSEEWISSRTGINERRISGPGEHAYVLASHAARRAVDDAGLEIEDIDAIIVGTISSHLSMPSCACMVQQEIGATKAFAFDVNAACSGFLYALNTGYQFISNNKEMKILCIGAETLSARTNWEDRNTCVLFADGAGATVIGFDEGERGILGSNIYSDGSLWRLLYMSGAPSRNEDLREPELEGACIRMEGKDVFKHAVRSMYDAVTALLEETGTPRDSIKLLIPHQANIRILNKISEKLGLTEEQVFINVANYGNTSAASVPIALDEAVKSGKISKGDLVLFCSFGGGFTWASCLLKW